MHANSMYDNAEALCAISCCRSSAAGPSVARVGAITLHAQYTDAQQPLKKETSQLLQPCLWLANAAAAQYSSRIRQKKMNTGACKRLTSSL
jgi:hypothetical protein